MQSWFNPWAQADVAGVRVMGGPVLQQLGSGAGGEGPMLHRRSLQQVGVCGFPTGSHQFWIVAFRCLCFMSNACLVVLFCRCFVPARNNTDLQP